MQHNPYNFLGWHVIQGLLTGMCSSSRPIWYDSKLPEPMP